MNKSVIFPLLAIGMMFMACNDEDVPPIAVNPQQPAFPAEGAVFTPSDKIAEKFDLKALNDAGAPMEMGTLSLVDFPSEYDIRVDLEISKDASFSSPGTVKTSVQGDCITVNPDDFEGVYLQSISKSPKEKTVYGRLAAYAVSKTDRNNVVRIGEPDKFINPETLSLSILPFPNDLVIEDNYYLLGTINGWSVAEAVKFGHSEGVSGYDEPTFTIAVDITPEQAAAGWWWKVIPQSTYIAGDWVEAANASYGVADNGDNALKGMLVARTADADCGSGCVTEAGSYLLTINLEEGTYDFTLAYSNLWTPGEANGWSQAASQKLYTMDYITYIGYARLNPAGFKFTTAPDWDHVNFGSAGTDGNLSTAPDAGNLTCPETGLYHCNVDIARLSYTLYPVSTIGVIGDATPGGWDNSTPLTPSDNLLVWEGDIRFAGGKEWKLRCNDAWEVSLGGEPDNLVQDGGNMSSPGEGVWHVSLDLSSLPYKVSLTK